MKIFDPHVHMTSRTTDDYERMAARRHRRDRRAGVLARPAAHPRRQLRRLLQQPRSGWERFRASQFGIRHFCTIGLNPKEANNPGARRRGARAAAALSREGRRRGGRRDRLRRPDRRGGGLPDAADRDRASGRTAGADPHAAPRQEAGHAAHHRGGARPRVSRRSGSSSTTTTRRRCRSCSTPAAGRGTPSIRTPRWTNCGWRRW